MSDGKKIPWEEAVNIAAHVSEHLAPWVQRSKCVGSVRRKRKEVGDIEFVVEPYFTEDLLGNREALTEPIREALLGIGTWVKGATRQMAISDVLDHPHVKLEVYIVHPPAHWGSIVAIRTGPAELGHYIMNILRVRGYRHHEGCVTRGKEIIPTPEEQDLFNLVDVPYVPASKRDELIADLKAGKHIGRVG